MVTCVLEAGSLVQAKIIVPMQHGSRNSHPCSNQSPNESVGVGRRAHTCGRVKHELGGRGGWRGPAARYGGYTQLGVVVVAVRERLRSSASRLRGCGHTR